MSFLISYFYFYSVLWLCRSLCKKYTVTVRKALSFLSGGAISSKVSQDGCLQVHPDAMEEEAVRCNTLSSPGALLTVPSALWPLPNVAQKRTQTRLQGQARLYIGFVCNKHRVAKGVAYRKPVHRGTNQLKAFPEVFNLLKRTELDTTVVV